MTCRVIRRWTIVSGQDLQIDVYWCNDNNGLGYLCLCDLLKAYSKLCHTLLSFVW